MDKNNCHDFESTISDKNNKYLNSQFISIEK